jgi:Protein of unknown function, DUF481.
MFWGRACAALLVGMMAVGVCGVDARAEAAPAEAAKVPEPELDQLVYKDGDRVRGRFVERVGDTLVFRSTRFGLLHVPAGEAELILAEPSEPVVAVAAEKAAQTGEAEVEVEVERWPFSPREIAEALKSVFGSWRGRLQVGAEVLQDVADHNSMTVDAKLQRKWKEDEVQLNVRYDYTAVNEKAATDMVKGSGVWRHELPGRFFMNYRPTVEWNRAYFRSGQPADYVLLQQELGVGINLFDTPTRKLRLGVSENMFDTWVTSTREHFAENIESMFAEFEAKLPWRITVTNRGVWYYSFADETDGWENRFEINQRLTETLSVGVRHETRRNNPDVRSADYDRLRLLFGLDF